jgi:hypothetical protein
MKIPNFNISVSVPIDKVVALWKRFRERWF